MSFPEPRNLHAKIVRRSPHRSTVFMLQFDITPLLGPGNEPLVEGEELERVLLWWCERAVKSTLAEARKKVPGHP